MLFHEVLASIENQTLNVPAGWGQGRATFGGLAGAIMFHELQKVVPGRVLRSLTVSFVGPLAPELTQITTEVLRSGKSVTQAESRLIQNGEVVGVLLASFGEPRTSSVSVPAERPPVISAPEATFAIPYIPGMTPEFTQNFDYRLAEGGLPYSNSSDTFIGGWMRFKNAQGPMLLEHLIGLVDAWPPATISMLKAPAPGSSLTWTLEIVGNLAGIEADDWLQYHADTEFAANGYAHLPSKIWDKNGNLLAISRQTVVIFG